MSALDGRRVGPGGTLCLLIACLSSPARAQEQDPTPAPVVWFRTSEGCPEAPTFLARLRRAAPQARLAQAGDSIDFVVTLGWDGSRAAGKLERQTSSGTVAIRELDAEHCEDVAEGLILTMMLSRSPRDDRGRGTDVAATPEAQPPEDRAPSPDLLPAAIAPAPTPPQNLDTLQTAAVEPARREPGRDRWSFGAQATALTGVVPATAAGAALFIELEPALLPVLRPSVRVSGAFTRTQGDRRDLAVRIASGGAEICPVRAGDTSLFFRPCAGFDVGRFDAEGSGSDGQAAGGLWAAAPVHGRLAWSPARAVTVELQAGIVVPVIRYELTSTAGRMLYQPGWIGGSFGVGAGLVLP
jgi:hypothetical protein